MKRRPRQLPFPWHQWRSERDDLPLALRSQSDATAAHQRQIRHARQALGVMLGGKDGSDGFHFDADAFGTPRAEDESDPDEEDR